MKICATTIVSANYLGYAKVLAASVATHFPDASFCVLLVDRRTPELLEKTSALPFRVLFAEELGLPDFERIAYQFDVLELNTCLKPTLLKKLVQEGHDAAIYWDPDIRLFSAPTPVVEALLTSSIVLTPHALSPLSDGARPSDIDIMRHGAYNLGFIAVRGDANGLALLTWWEDVCLSFGFNDPALGTFVDQRWLDLAPCYFAGVHVLKHRGCNVAYWNLHERPVSVQAGQLQAGDQPLVFFHFSGVDANLPDNLSKYQNRHAYGPETQVHRLVTDYCKALLEAGHQSYTKIAYSFGQLSDGRSINALMRKALGSIGRQERQPFDASSPFQRRLRDAGLSFEPPTAGASSGPKVTTFNFDEADRRIVAVNTAIRLGAKLLGTQRIQLLLRYFMFLARGSNLAAVLLRAPFVLEQTPRSVQQGEARSADAPPALR